ncbi:N-acetyltransferase [Collimonas sp. H4R21]|uniref:N-acetyltransferase n=1 Tax=Collimonas rhizosphaerae TaxID=3126357 RepID=A0ABU9PWJ1_9BURK
MLVLEPSLANFARLAGVGGHQLLYHPASQIDIERDKDSVRRARTLARLDLYTKLEGTPPSPRNTPQTSPNDSCDNDILHALECSAVHALVTEDKDIHAKARLAGFGHRIYNIQTAEDWLRRLHEPSAVHFPNIEDVHMYSLTGQLNSALFDSLRASYDTPERSFNTWFHEKAQTGRKTWVARIDHGEIEALCIYAMQTDEIINNDRECLHGLSLKLCTFKVGEQIRGRKIGELFLKAAFRFATENRCENIFIHTNPEQVYLLELLSDFGFEQRGMYGADIMLVKAHPSSPPEAKLPALDYARLYFPHYRKDTAVQKFLVPIKPQYHQILFPELAQQTQLFENSSAAGNAIKQAYLCKAPTNQVQPGDIVLFYRTEDTKAVTTVGIVECYEIHDSATNIMQLVSRRTVYSQRDIEVMATTPTKVMLFRLVGHFPTPIRYTKLIQENIVSGAIQSITKISDDSFSRLLRLSQQ